VSEYCENNRNFKMPNNINLASTILKLYTEKKTIQKQEKVTKKLMEFWKEKITYYIVIDLKKKLVLKIADIYFLFYTKLCS
jgi:hypothetical protein